MAKTPKKRSLVKCSCGKPWKVKVENAPTTDDGKTIIGYWCPRCDAAPEERE